MYFVHIIDLKTDEVVHTIKAGESEKRAERVEDGVLINLDSERFRTEIVYKQAEKKP
jgi:hypothetical protein